ncbi:hypothetical protein GS504_24460 [Rhodococcus hoagii]|nr:hypothetical protein [Prescottella equi]
MTSPKQEVPDRAYVGNAGSGQHVVGIQSWDEELIRRAQRTPIDGAFGNARNTLWGPGGFLGLIIATITQGIASTLGELSSFFGNLFGLIDTHTVELAGLQSTTQKLEGVIGYAHGYITGGWSGQLGPAKRSVTGVIGTTVGVTRQSGAYYLHSKGLWVADARMNIDQAGFAVGTTTELQIRVYSPSGALHAIAVSLHNTGARHPHVVHLPFTVPSAGYYVEFWADVPVARNAWGGSQFNGFSVEKRSLEET